MNKVVILGSVVVCGGLLVLAFGCGTSTPAPGYGSTAQNASSAGTGAFAWAGTGGGAGTGTGGGAGTGAGTNTAGTGATTPSNTGGSGSGLSFDVLTHEQGGRYAPQNVGAIWIEDSSGRYVKTLQTWYQIRGGHLVKFMSEAGGNQVDAVTAATYGFHTTHHVSWDFTDVNRQPVPNGAYQLIIEVTDSNRPGQWVTVPFTKGSGPQTLTPADQAYYTGMRLSVP